MNSITEIWKDIPGFVGEYQASNTGKVRSVSRMVNHNKGGLKRVRERILKPSMSNLYLSVSLGRKVTMRVHVIIALTFLGERPNNFAINHKDGDKINNAVSNLEYCTHSENTLHAAKVLGVMGKKRAAAPEQVHIVRSLIADGIKQKVIASQLGLTVAVVKSIAQDRPAYINL